ncbi:MAG TPA: hypothetical protein VMC83_21910 [Streptosporangiaceae bacterium]|nr:hypothetical protein [Streptosporangiaceae bacterium]
MDEDVIRAAQGAFAWRTVNADLELLSLDEGFMLTDDVLVRGSGPGAPQRLVFRGERLSVEVEIDEIGIVGQLMPPQPGEVTLVTADGPQATTQADDVGCFAFPLPASGPLRLDCRISAEHFMTEWVTI